jgi:hypothetical protein
MGFRPARAAIPAKGDRGKSESAMQRSYFEMHRTEDIAAVARYPCKGDAADEIRRAA